MEKIFSFFMRFLGSKRIEQMRLGRPKGTGYCVEGGGFEKGAHALQDRLPAKDFGRNYPENRNKLF